MKRLFSLLLLTWVLSVPASAQATLTPTQRLATLARVWGFLKYHHPGIARPHLNWDSVLVASLAPVQATRTRQEFNAELTKLLRLLGPLPTQANVLPAHLLARNVDLAWLQEDPALAPPLRTALQRVLACHAFATPHPYLTATSAGVISHQERAYAAPALPTPAYRLLGLFRYWNIIQYYYPYKYAIGGDWKAILPRFIPRFQQVHTPLAYHLLVVELVAQLHDTHGFVYGSAVLAAQLGDYYPPLELAYLDGQVVVARLYPTAVASPLPLAAGAVVLAVGGIPVPQLLARYRPYAAASTAAAAQREVLRWLLRGPATDSLALTVQTPSGPRTVRVPRPLGLHATTDALYLAYYRSRQEPDTAAAWRELPGQVGYVHLGRLKPEQLTSLRPRLLATKGLVLDLRTYPPSGVVEQLSTYLQPAGVPYVTFRVPLLTCPGYAYEAGTYTTPAGSADRPAPYTGHVVVLVNEKTQSYAEMSAMLLQTIPGVVVLGSETAGADGNIVAVPFPGGLLTYYSGIGMYYPDGRETQRVGIVPTRIVRPTIAGIQAGRDEVLDQALRYLTEQ
jgi:C-terminal processing protease CtpA/Prc